MLEKFAAQSLVEYDGELIFSKEKFAELIVKECVTICNDTNDASYLNGVIAGRKIKQHFGVEE
jgi:hypothetical protein